MTQGGILTGPAIREALKLGDIEIDPFVSENVNPASIDLTLGRGACQYVGDVLDSKCELNVHRWEADVFTLEPGQLYLLHTAERVFSKKFIGCLDGKSSIGRLGIVCHLTAGYVDPGFDGQVTLEVTSVYRVRVYAGMRFCQLRFHSAAGEVTDYREKGNYTGKASMGAVPSMTWRQFK